MHRRSTQVDGRLSRRSFLKAAGLTALGAPAIAGPHRHPPVPPDKRPRIVQIASAHVVHGPVVHKTVLSEMLDASLIALTKTDSVKAAWHAILSPNDIVGLKFNRSGQRNIGTSGVFGDVLISSLTEAGWSPKQIVCIEGSPDNQAIPATRPAIHGFARSEVDFGSGRDRLAAVLDQVTALIDIPFLKTHNIAVLTCALKNLSHGLVKHPARYHANGCSPYIADIVALDEIHKKLRLCVVDALRIVYRNGPNAVAEDIEDNGTILVGFDPVAIDTVGLIHLNDIRRRHDLPPIAHSSAEISYLMEAELRGLGVADPHAIDRIRLHA